MPPNAFFSICPSSVSVEIISTSVFASSASSAKSSMTSFFSTTVNDGALHFAHGFPTKPCLKSRYILAFNGMLLFVAASTAFNGDTNQI